MRASSHQRVDLERSAENFLSVSEKTAVDGPSPAPGRDTFGSVRPQDASANTLSPVRGSLSSIIDATYVIQNACLSK